ncbi:transglycosylase SLT domain-containing protein [soil metagenome]
MSVAAIGLASGVEQAVRAAASATGVDFTFLLSTAKRESGYNPLARAGTSSAAGLFQFLDQTWLGAMKRHGASHGYARYADLIQQGMDGRYSVAGDEAKRAVMELRFDPHASAIMAGELTAEHAAYLRGRVGREPTGGELYAAHFLGPQGSARLIEAAAGSPGVSAASMFPEAAAANRGVFFHDGQALTAGQVYANLSRTGGTDLSALGTRSQADPGQGAFATYAGAGRIERRLEQAMLVQMILGSSQGQGFSQSSGSGGGAASSLLSAQLLSALSEAKTDAP